MDKKKFEEVIQFAIQRESESVDFYNRASQITKFSGTQELFLDFAKQEEGHRRLLQDLDMDKLVKARIESVPDLKISDYMIDSELKPDSSYAEILRVAMKREEQSVKLYTVLKEPTTDPDLKRLFTFLAGEESKHKYKLEKIYDDEILK